MQFRIIKLRWIYYIMANPLLTTMCPLWKSRGLWCLEKRILRETQKPFKNTVVSNICIPGRHWEMLLPNFKQDDGTWGIGGQVAPFYCKKGRVCYHYSAQQSWCNDENGLTIWDLWSCLILTQITEYSTKASVIWVSGKVPDLVNKSLTWMTQFLGLCLIMT